MEHFEVVIVGAGPAGFNAAKTVRELYPEKRVLVINDRESLQIPCSLPWAVAGKVPLEKNAYPLERVKEFGELLIEKVVSVEPSSQRVFTETRGFTYEKLILATGWRPRVLTLKGSELKGIFYADASTQKVRELREEVLRAKRVAIVGGGFISIGFADVIKRSHPEKEITVIEATNRLASGAFSGSFEVKIEENLKRSGVKIVKEVRVEGFEGSERVERVLTSKGEVEAEVVLVFIGFLPRTRLAVEAGIKTKGGFIEVDDFLRTSADGVLAAGNCVLHHCPITGREIPAMFASVSARDGRVAGVNTAGPEVRGRATVPMGITEVGGELFGFAGYTEEALRKEGIEFKSARVKTSDAYPKAIGAKEVEVEAFFGRDGKFLGLQVRGYSRAAWAITETAGRLIERGLTAREVVAEVSPAFPTATPSPLLQPVQEAALKCF